MLQLLPQSIKSTATGATGRPLLGSPTVAFHTFEILNFHYLVTDKAKIVKL